MVPDLLLRRTGSNQVISRSAKAVPSGVIKGLTTIAGLPHLWEDFGDWMLGQMGRIPGMTPNDVQEMRDAIALGRQYSNFRNIKTPTSAGWRDIIEHVTGPLYEPRTRPGRVVGNIAEFAPAAVLGPGGLGRNLINFAVIPGATSEIAGQISGLLASILNRAPRPPRTQPSVSRQ
jgi:hypothetical protein